MAKTGDDDFLARWSRRKRGEHSDEPRRDVPRPDAPRPDAPKPEEATRAGEVPVAEAGPEAEDQGDPEVMANLPDIDSMDDSSDFKVFLQAGVPEALRRRALRKLWGVNPVLANLDGLNDYDEDYTQLHTWGRGMKTLYQAGKGFVTGDPEAPAAEGPADAAEPMPESPIAGELETPGAAAPESVPAQTDSPTESAAARSCAARRRRWGTTETSS